MGGPYWVIRVHGLHRGLRMVVRARAAIRAGSCRLQVPEHKFKSHPGVPPARLTVVLLEKYFETNLINANFI